MNDLDEKQLEVEYKKRKSSYLSLGRVLQGRLKNSLKNEKVDFDFIQKRVKSFPSFFEKIFRYGLKNPFDEIQDFCG
jgi:putative GTP pyrophosphokinase